MLCLCWTAQARSFIEAGVKIDIVSDSLFTSLSNDTTTLELLQLLCTVFRSFTSRLLADHLDSGCYASPAPEVSLQAQSVLKTNRLSEKDFALRVSVKLTEIPLVFIILANPSTISLDNIPTFLDFP